MPMVAPCRVMATGVFDSRKRDRFSRNSRIPTLVACMVSLDAYTMIPQPFGDERLPSPSRPPALAPRLARPAEMFAAGRAWRGAAFAEEVDAVVAQEERVGGGGTTFAPG